MNEVNLLNYTQIGEINDVFSLQENSKSTINNKSIHERKLRLKELKSTIIKYRHNIQEALFKDFSKPFSETDLTEIWPVLAEIKHARNNLNKWSQPQDVNTPITMLGTSASLYYAPKGTVLVIAPWNFPFNLTFGPMISAIAAGNNVVVKPSEMTPHSTLIMDKIIREVFPPEEVSLVNGAVEETQHLLSLSFDHIFFTGSPQVGKVVMEAAAKNLTSVTLELGGKSPAIIDNSADIKDAAQKLAWGKFINNGQTCIAPDYILVSESKADDFKQSLQSAIEGLYSMPISKDENYSRIVNKKHHQRLVALLEDAVSKGARVITGGEHDDRYFSPTILERVTFDMKIMNEEIFGPILPVMKFTDIEEALEMVGKNPKPLAAYLFTKKEEVKKKIALELEAGGICINDCVIHYAHINLPFGGNGTSGTGRAHGYYGFQAFSNLKPVLKQRIGFTTSKLLYPPYSNTKQKLINLLLKYF